MADKLTPPAVDVRMEPRLTLRQFGPRIEIDRAYTFLATGDTDIPELRGGRILTVVTFASLPQNMKDAFVALNAYTKTQALLQEGMST